MLVVEYEAKERVPGAQLFSPAPWKNNGRVPSRSRLCDMRRLNSVLSVGVKFKVALKSTLDSSPMVLPVNWFFH